MDQLSGRGRLAFVNKISPPKFFRRQIHGARHLIEVALHGENTLRRAESAKRAVRRSVGRHGPRMDAHVGAEIRPRRVNRSAREHHGRKRRVRAAVNHEIDVHRHQLAVARDAGAMPRARRMALGGRHHVFRAVVNNFHGLPGLPRQKRRVPRDHRGIFFLAAESAAGLRLNHANFFRRQIEQWHERLVHVVGTLQRSPDRHAVRGICRRDHALVFDVELFLRAGPILAFDDDVRLRPCGVHVAFFHVIRLEDVVLSKNNGAFRDGILDRKNRGQRLDIDLHRAARLLEQISIRMREQDDRLLRDD